MSQVNSKAQREAQYRSARPANHHEFAPIKGEYSIIKVEVVVRNGQTAHLATAYWRVDDSEPICKEATFKFYLECLYGEMSEIPKGANIDKMAGCQIVIDRAYSFLRKRNGQNKYVPVYFAAWRFKESYKEIEHAIVSESTKLELSLEEIIEYIDTRKFMSIEVPDDELDEGELDAVNVHNPD